MLDPERWDGEVDSNGSPANSEFYLDCTLQNTQEAIKWISRIVIDRCHDYWRFTEPFYNDLVKAYVKLVEASAIIDRNNREGCRMDMLRKNKDNLSE